MTILWVQCVLAWFELPDVYLVFLFMEPIVTSFALWTAVVVGNVKLTSNDSMGWSFTLTLVL